MNNKEGIDEEQAQESGNTSGITPSGSVSQENDHDGGKLTDYIISNRLQLAEALQPIEELNVTDISGGCGASFSIMIVTAAFDNLSVIERHRLIHAALGSIMNDLHAVQLKCYTPRAFAKISASLTEKQK